MQTLHYRRFDKLQCQFLEMVAHNSVGTLGDCKSPFGEFRDQDGYAGYVPSQGYFGRFYDMMVEAEAPELQQMISSRPAQCYDFIVSICLWLLSARHTMFSLSHSEAAVRPSVLTIFLLYL